MDENEVREPAVGDPIASNHPLLSRRGLFKLSLVGGGALLIGPGFLAACSSDGSGGTGGTGGAASSPSGSGSTPSSAGGSTPSASAGGASASTPAGSGSTGAAGGSITVGVVGDIINFDSYADGTGNFILLDNLNTFLINYDDKLQPSPSALTKWEISSDHTQVTMTLRDGIKMQTGKVWAADDLVQSFQRAANPDEGNQLYGPMAVVKDYKATDDHTVVLTFSQPVSDGTVTDLLESFPAMDKDVNNSKYLATKPGSGGPFQLVSRDPNNDIVVKRFPDYWDAQDVHLDQVTFKIFGDNNTMVSALQSGAVDVIYNFPPTSAAQLKDQFTIIEGYPGALVDCLRININTKPFDNIKLRQAIARAIDRDRIVKEVYFGYSQPLYLPWGPNSPANDPAYAQKNSYDLDAAKKLWQEAGSPASAEALANGGDALHLQMLQILQQSLQQIGFNLTINTVDNATFTSRLLAGTFGILFGGLGNTSKSNPTRINTNSIYRTADNPVLKDKLPQDYVDAINAANKAVTPDDEKAAYATLNEVISTQAFGIPVCVAPTLTATKKTVTGVSRTVDNWLILGPAKVSS